MRWTTFGLVLAGCAAHNHGPGETTDATAADTQIVDASPGVTSSVITDAHRFVPGKMFGGWGPHLGHLLRRAQGDELWFADDGCDQGNGADTCDVNVDRRVDYFKLAGGAWTKVASQPLPATVQQNTASLLVGDTIYTYGVDVAHAVLVECTLSCATSAVSCAPLALDVGAGANYIGAAVSPQGYKVVWLTNVQDGGGGSFRYYVDYGGGWNGPRTGGVGGYNDASYIDVAFGTGMYQNEILMHAEVVSGLAPNWTFLGAVGSADLSTTDPATWTLALAPMAADDPVISTDDVAIDPVTNDAHLFARTQLGNALYYHRPAGGTWSGPLASFASTYRVRLMFSADGTLHAVYGPSQHGLAWRSVPAASRSAGAPISWSMVPDHVASMPAGYESIDAIYPESSIYQSAPVTGLHVTVVGDTVQNEALLVSIDEGS